MQISLHARNRADLAKFSFSEISIQQRLAIGRDEEVKAPVVVVVAHTATDAAFRERSFGLVHAELRRNVDEFPAVVAVERVLVCLLVGLEYVQVTVLVHVEPA